MWLPLSYQPTETMFTKKLDSSWSLMLGKGNGGTLVPVRGELARDRRFHRVLMTGQTTLQERQELRQEWISDGRDLNLMSGTWKWTWGVNTFLYLSLFPEWPHWINLFSLPSVLSVKQAFWGWAAELPLLWLQSPGSDPDSNSNEVFSSDGHLHLSALSPWESWQSSKF